MTTALWVGSHERGDVLVAEPHGVLDAATYLPLRDVLVELGVEEPRAVIVDLADLDLSNRSALAVFVAVSDQLAQWPGVPVLLVATRAAHRELLDRHRLARFVPVFASVPAAVAAMDEPPARRIARRSLPNSLVSVRLARRFVAQVCARWGVQGRLQDAVMIADVLVENTLIHTYCAPTVRVELRRGRLTVAVYDDDPSTARLLETGDVASSRVRGLWLVHRIARAWGCERRSAGGKVVWAVL